MAKVIGRTESTKDFCYIKSRCHRSMSRPFFPSHMHKESMKKWSFSQLIHIVQLNFTLYGFTVNNAHWRGAMMFNKKMIEGVELAQIQAEYLYRDAVSGTKTIFDNNELQIISYYHSVNIALDLCVALMRQTELLQSIDEPVFYDRSRRVTLAELKFTKPST